MKFKKIYISPKPLLWGQFWGWWRGGEKSVCRGMAKPGDRCCAGNNLHWSKETPMNQQSKTASIWHATSEGTKYPQLSGDISVDVAIVGGGITGLTAAVLLQRNGLNVALLEASRIGSGVTGNTTAHISEVPDMGYRQLIASLGEEQAQRVVQSRRIAIETIASFVKTDKIDCEFERLSGYLYAESESEVSQLERETQAARKLGVSASAIADVPLPFPVKGGILFSNQAQFHALKYLQGLANAFTGEGGKIYEDSRVLDIDIDRDPLAMSTAGGKVTAKEVILATIMPIHDLLKMQEILPLTTKAAPYRSYVMGVRLDGVSAPKGLFWDTAQPYHYTRCYNTPAGEMLVVGGEDHKTGQEIDETECYRKLEQYLRDRYPIAAIDYRWSAQLYEPVDGLPFIGSSALHPHLHFATGYSGNGMSFGTIAGLIFSDSILGNKNPWKKLYDPNRFNLVASAQGFLSENIEVAKHFIGDRFKADVHSLSQVPLKEGRIVEVGGEQVAVYRDESGDIHTLSPVCTHAHCIVNWNAAEKSWDCPCHGGRFSATGEVLNGPPIKDLQRRSLLGESTTSRD